jgi:hypothetical protein
MKDGDRIKKCDWEDIKKGLELERKFLGEDVAWSDQRTKIWYEKSAIVGLAFYKKDELCGYISALSIKKKIFDQIKFLKIQPWDITDQDLEENGEYFLIGAALVKENERGQGVATTLSKELLEMIGGSVIADAFSYEAEKMLNKLGWARLGENPNPLYIKC